MSDSQRPSEAIKAVTVRLISVTRTLGPMVPKTNRILTSGSIELAEDPMDSFLHGSSAGLLHRILTDGLHVGRMAHLNSRSLDLVFNFRSRSLDLVLVHTTRKREVRSVICLGDVIPKCSSWVCSRMDVWILLLTWVADSPTRGPSVIQEPRSWGSSSLTFPKREVLSPKFLYRFCARTGV